MRLRKIAILLISTLTALSAAEIAARIAAPTWLKQRMDRFTVQGPMESDADRNSDRDWSVIRNKNGIVTHFQPGTIFRVVNREYSHECTIDALGCRQSLSTQEPESSPGLAFCGDSFVFGLGLQDTETIPSLYNLRSNAKAINAGIPGSSLLPQIAQVRDRHTAWNRPRKIVFFIYLGNDMVDTVGQFHKRNIPTQTRAKKTTERPSVLTDINSYFHRFPLNRCYLAWLAKHATRNALSRGKDYRSSDPRLQSAVVSLRDEQVAAFKVAATEARDLADDLAADILFVLIPPKVMFDRREQSFLTDYYQADSASLNFQQPYEIATETLRGLDIKYVDQIESLRQKYLPNWYYVDDDHFTAEGCRAFVEAVRMPLEEWLNGG